MNIFELLLEDEDYQGVDAISLVETPAMESDFVALNEDKRVLLAEVNKDKRILLGTALIPEKPIYRNQDGKEFYIYFSKDTIRKVAENFFKQGNQSNATLEHQEAIEGITVFESWIVEDEIHDKSRKYGLNAPVGSWVLSMKVDNEDVWSNYVKNDKVFGFSIEGRFADKLMKSKKNAQLSDNKLNKIIDDFKREIQRYYNANH